MTPLEESPLSVFRSSSCSCSKMISPSLRAAGFENSGSTELAEVLSAVAFA